MSLSMALTARVMTQAQVPFLHVHMHKPPSFVVDETRWCEAAEDGAL